MTRKGKLITHKKTDIACTRKRYDRIARFYDFMESPMEGLRFVQWRSRLQERVTGKRALEVGVGTGKNIPYYPPHVEVTAIDISPRMLERAKIRANALGRSVELLEMDSVIMQVVRTVYARSGMLEWYGSCSVFRYTQGHETWVSVVPISSPDDSIPLDKRCLLGKSQ